MKEEIEVPEGIDPDAFRAGYYRSYHDSLFTFQEQLYDLAFHKGWEAGSDYEKEKARRIRKDADKGPT